MVGLSGGASELRGRGGRRRHWVILSLCQIDRHYLMISWQLLRRRSLRDVCSLAHFWVPALSRKGELLVG